MDSKDWYNCGAKIGELVQSAIDSNNFKQLNEAITETINETMESVQGSISKSMERQRSAMPGKSGMGVYRGTSIVDVGGDPLIAPPGKGHFPRADEGIGPYVQKNSTHTNSRLHF